MTLKSLKLALAIGSLSLISAPLAIAGPASSSSAYGLTGSTAITAPQSAYNDHRDFAGDNLSYQYERGVTNFQDGNFTNATLNFRRVLRNDPHHAKAILFMGLSKQKLGNHKQAIRYLNVSKQIFSDVPQVYVALGKSLIADGKTGQAKKVLVDLNGLKKKCADSCSEKSDIEAAQKIMSSQLGL